MFYISTLPLEAVTLEPLPNCTTGVDVPAATLLPPKMNGEVFASSVLIDDPNCIFGRLSTAGELDPNSTDGAAIFGDSDDLESAATPN
jgi:hypothetical protein